MKRLSLIIAALIIAGCSSEPPVPTAPGDMKVAPVGSEPALLEPAPPGSLADASAILVEPVAPPMPLPMGIIGGTTARLADYPGRVKIEVLSWDASHGWVKEHCAGDVITRSRVDTAGHCVAPGWSQVRVLYGDALLYEARSAEPSAVLLHAGYRFAGDPRDLGVLIFADPLPEYVPTRRYASLAELLPLIGAPVPIASWGLTAPPDDQDTGPSEMLLETRVRLTSADDLIVTARSIGGSGDCMGGSGTGLGQSLTLGRFSAVTPTPDGRVCVGGSYEMIFVSPVYAERWGNRAVAAWEASR